MGKDVWDEIRDFREISMRPHEVIKFTINIHSVLHLTGDMRQLRLHQSINQTMPDEWSGIRAMQQKPPQSNFLEKYQNIPS